MAQAFSFSAPRFTEEDEIRELAAMTDAEREEVRQDLYGTHTELEETDELRENSLEQMQQCLDGIPEGEKEVYLEACQVCPELVRTESAPIRFLRSENYQAEVRMMLSVFVWMWEVCDTVHEDAVHALIPVMLIHSLLQRAAQRLVKYWDYRKRVFDERAFLRMQLDEGALYPEDESTLRWGHTEILPDDKNGRLVLSHDRSNFNLNQMNHPSVVCTDKCCSHDFAMKCDFGWNCC